MARATTEDLACLLGRGDSLSAEQWTHVRCLFYRVYDGLSVAEVAYRMGVSERTVKRWTNLALGYHEFPEIKAIKERIAAARSRKTA